MNGLMNASNVSTSSFSWNNLRQAVAKIKALQRNYLRSSSKMLDKMECNICGRKATIIHDCGRETVVVCLHVWDALQRQLPRVIMREPLLASIRIEVVNDGEKE